LFIGKEREEEKN